MAFFTVKSSKPPILLNRFLRNSLFFTHGCGIDINQLFCRKSRKLSWFLGYQSTLNFITSIVKKRSSQTQLKRNSYQVHKRISTKFLVVLKRNKDQYPVSKRKVEVLNVPFSFEAPVNKKVLLLVPPRVTQLFTARVLYKKVLSNGIFDSAISEPKKLQAIIADLFRIKYGLELNTKDLHPESRILLNSSLKRQGLVKRKNFPDTNKSTRPTGPENNIFSTYKSFFLILRAFPTLVITFRANNLFFVLSSPKGNVLFSYSVGLGEDFKKASRRSVFAYDAASREFAKKVKQVTSIVKLRIHGQSKRRFYVLKNLKKGGLRFIFLQDVIPFACNGVKKPRRARKRRRL